MPPPSSESKNKPNKGLASSDCSLLHAGLFLDLFIYSENEDDTVLRNVGLLWKDYMSQKIEFLKYHFAWLNVKSLNRFWKHRNWIKIIVRHTASGNIRSRDAASSNRAILHQSDYLSAFVCHAWGQRDRQALDNNRYELIWSHCPFIPCVQTTQTEINAEWHDCQLFAPQLRFYNRC